MTTSSIGPLVNAVKHSFVSALLDTAKSHPAGATYRRSLLPRVTFRCVLSGTTTSRESEFFVFFRGRFIAAKERKDRRKAG